MYYFHIYNDNSFNIKYYSINIHIVNKYNFIILFFFFFILVKII